MPRRFNLYITEGKPWSLPTHKKEDFQFFIDKLYIFEKVRDAVNLIPLQIGDRIANF